MRMRRKNGFTLIELLAIIVILAIIAVITIPIILNIIDNSKRGAVKDSAYGYKDSINKFYVAKLVDDPNYSIPDGTYTLVDLDTLGVSVSGDKPDSNSWVYIKKNSVFSACLQFDEYKVDIVDGVVGNTVKGLCERISVQITDSDNSESISLGDLVQIGDDMFWVIGTDESNTKLLTRYTLNSSSRQASTGHMNISFSSSIYWYVNNAWDSSNFSQDSQGKYYVYRTNTGDDTDNNLKLYVNNYKDYLVEQGLPNSIDARLMSYEEAYENGCRSSAGTCPDYIGRELFWLGSTYNSSKLWYVYSYVHGLDYVSIEGDNGYFSYDDVGFGVRPIIIIPTSLIPSF